MELLQLKYFQDVAYTENTSITAKKMFVSQSTISHAIKRLEEELGVSLFNRVGNRIVLNNNGRKFLCWVEAALSNLNRGVQELYLTSMQKTNWIRIGIESGRNITAGLSANTDIILYFHPDILWRIKMRSV